MGVLGKYEIEMEYCNGDYQSFMYDNFVKAKRQFEDFLKSVKPLYAVLMDYMGHKIICATYDRKTRKYNYERERGF